MANYGKNTKQPYCSFCGKSSDMVERLIAGPGVYICNECIGLCNNILDEEMGRDEPEGIMPGSKKEKKSAAKDTVKLALPSEMKKTLDDYVIGQERAKKAMCVAVYNHYKRINHQSKRV